MSDFGNVEVQNLQNKNDALEKEQAKLKQKIKVYDQEIFKVNQKNKELEVEVDDLRH